MSNSSKCREGRAIQIGFRVDADTIQPNKHGKKGSFIPGREREMVLFCLDPNMEASAVALDSPKVVDTGIWNGVYSFQLST
ncbi:MAG: hypothetical protein JW929_02130 [Anaerolineales bacterium]|nr:hypothetical protein [Anaerolineales bacterium]